MEERDGSVNTSSWTQHTGRPNKLRCWNLEQRKIYCRAVQEDRWLMSWSLGRAFLAKWEGRVTGAVSQVTLIILRLREGWGCVLKVLSINIFHLVGGFHIWEQLNYSGNVIRYCSPGPSERGWSRGCGGGPSGKAPGSCWATCSRDHLSDMTARHLLHTMNSFLTHVWTKTIPAVYDEVDNLGQSNFQMYCWPLL